MWSGERGDQTPSRDKDECWARGLASLKGAFPLDVSPPRGALQGTFHRLLNASRLWLEDPATPSPSLSPLHSFRQQGSAEASSAELWLQTGEWRPEHASEGPNMMVSSGEGVGGGGVYPCGPSLPPAACHGLRTF